jgi:pimeloyl-ACP methyl ester carboxylesterase
MDLRSVVLVGHSYGGAIALRATLQELDVPLRRIVGLAVLAAGPKFQVDPRLLTASAEPVGIADVAAQLRLSLRGAVESRDVVATASSLALTPWSTTLADLEACVGFDCRAELGRIGVPVTVIAGGEDPIVPSRYAGFLASAVQNGSLVSLPTVGHHPTLESLDTVARAVADLVARGSLNQRESTEAKT